jgi:hypothetical protein
MESDNKDNPKTKRRKDFSDKKKERKNNDQKVVKCFLQSAIIDKDNLDILVQNIEERVISFSKRQVVASIGLNFIIKELFNNVPLEDIKYVQIPDILDVTFIRQLLLGTNSARIVAKEVQQLYELHPYLLKVIQDIPRHQGDRNIYSAGAIKYCTNIHNHFWTNVKKRTYRFINQYIPDESKNIVMSYLMNWKLFPELEKVVQSLPEETIRLIKLLKDILGDDNISESWCKSKVNFCRLVRHSMFISQVVDGKQFSIVPMSKLKRHYISIDTSTLYGILKELNLFEGDDTTFTSMKDEHWRSVINFERLEGKNCKFTYTIETDGTAVSIHFERPKKNKETIKKCSFDDPNTDYWACDPGRTNIFYMVKKNKDGTFDSLRLSRRQYYKESGITKAKSETIKWLQKQSIIDANLSSYSSKGHCLVQFKKFVENYLSNWDNLWNDYSDKKWSIQRMKLYGGKKRVFANFMNKLNNSGRNIVIGYGSAKFSPTSKNELAVPVSRAYKECTFRFNTILVNEFRTSKIYSGDGTTVLDMVKTQNNRTVRGLLWYSSTIKGENKFVNRDLNAAINILNCLVNPARPMMLCRSDQNEKIVQKVGRILLC